MPTAFNTTSNLGDISTLYNPVPIPQAAKTEAPPFTTPNPFSPPVQETLGAMMGPMTTNAQALAVEEEKPAEADWMTQEGSNVTGLAVEEDPIENLKMGDDTKIRRAIRGLERESQKTMKDINQSLSSEWKDPDVKKGKALKNWFSRLSNRI